MSNPSGFASVKLPAALVQQAREAAQPLRRSAAGQIEYWATLGRVVEHSGLTVQESRDAIERYEAAAREARLGTQPEPLASAEGADALEALKQRVLAVSTNGSLQARIRDIVEDNRRRVGPQAAA
jgi:ParD-like antitoxin of type II bacterial toxin-antitoxin system